MTNEPEKMDVIIKIEEKRNTSSNEHIDKIKKNFEILTSIGCELKDTTKIITIEGESDETYVWDIINYLKKNITFMSSVQKIELSAIDDKQFITYEIKEGLTKLVAKTYYADTCNSINEGHDMAKAKKWGKENYNIALADDNCPDLPPYIITHVLA